MTQEEDPAAEDAPARRLTHLWLHPGARLVRLMLTEKDLPFDLVLERAWERGESAPVPLLVEPSGLALSDPLVIAEYLEDIAGRPALIGTLPLDRAEVRQQLRWFEQVFQPAVTDRLVGEKVLRRLMRAGMPDSQAVRAGHQAIDAHLAPLDRLAESRPWLAGARLSLADLAAAAHLSAIDYLGDVPWQWHPALKDWYARMKSRPAMRPLLKERVPGMPPAAHYDDPDF